MSTPANRWSLFLFALLLTARAWAQSITLEQIRVDHIDGNSYTFTPGENNVLPTTRFVTFRNTTATYTPVVSFDAAASPIVQCDVFDTVPENGYAGALTSLGVASNPVQTNRALPSGLFAVEMPPRGIGGIPSFPERAIQPGEAEREIIYTFACTIGSTAGFENGPRSDIVVRQQLDPAVQSVAVTSVSPDPSLPLTPGAQQEFVVMVDWAENTFSPISGALRLKALDAQGNELAQPRQRALNRVLEGDFSTTSGSLELSILAPVPSDGVVVLKIEMIEQLTIDHQQVTTGPWAKAADIVYGGDISCPAPTESTSALNPKGQSSTSCLPDFTIQHIEAVQVIQDIDNSVPLVAGKPTWLRIYVGADGDPAGDNVSHPKVPVTVTVRTEDGAVVSFDFDSDGPRPDTRQLQVKRDSAELIDKLGHFSIKLPPDLVTAGELEVEAKVNVAADISLLAPELDDTNNTALAKFQVIETRPVIVEYLEVCEAECGDEIGFEALLQHFAPTDDVRYSAFTRDPIRPGRADLPELLSQVAMFALGRLVDYFVVWAPDSLDFEVPEETEILRNLNTHLQALGAAPLLFAEAEQSESFPFSQLQTLALNEEVAGTLPLALGLVSSLECRDASDLSPITAEGWRGTDGPVPIASRYGPQEMQPSCAGSPLRGFHVSQGLYLSLLERLRSNRAFLAGSRKQQGAAQEYFLVTGTAEANSGTISPIVRASLAVRPNDLPASGDVCVESQANGSPRARQCMQRSSATRDRLPFIFPVPYDASVDRIALFVDGIEVGARSSSANAPAVAIVSPLSGATINAADPFTLSWTASDGDGDLVESAVLYSPDGGSSWTPLRLRVEGASAELDLTRLAGGTDVLFRVQASDGFRTAEATVGPINLVQAPRIDADAVVDLGTTGDGFALQGSVSIRNTGSGRLTVHRVSSDSAAFRTPQKLPMTVAAGEQRTIVVEFTPPGPGAASARLTLESDDAATPARDVELRARARDASEPVLAILDEPQTLAFPEVIVGDGSLGSLSVINQGASELSLGVSVAGNGFRLVEDSAVSPSRIEQAASGLMGGEQRDIVIGFSPPSSGEFTGTLTLTSGDPMRPQVQMALSGKGREAAQRATVNPGGIVNAASFASEISPGGIGSLFGVQLAEGMEVADRTPLPLSLGGAEVFVGGWPAPLFFTSSNQINFQTPFEIAGRSTAPVIVRRDGVDSAPVAVAVRANAPGVFVNPANSEPIVTRADGSLITAANPARAGDVLIVFATGVGELSSPPLTGAASLATPLASAPVLPSVTVGGTAAQVFFVGLTPGFVGLAQINIQLAEPLPAGAALDLVINFGGAESPVVLLPVGP